MNPSSQLQLVMDLGQHLCGHPMVERFQKFHSENPKVYHELRKLALDLKIAGRSHYGMKGLFEVLRWHRALKTTGDDFKLNNNYTAFYSRLIMKREPQLKDFFLIRDSVADKK